MKKLQYLFLALYLFAAVASAAQTGDHCEVVQDCPSLHSCTNNKCVHKTLFPITAREVIGTIIILIMNCLLTAGGVGGGAAYVPYIMLLFEVNLSKAIAYAYVCVFGGGVGNLLNVILLKNPKTKRFMINYDVNLIILPALMVGIYIGLILQRMFPPLVTNIILLIVLLYSMYKNYIKFRATRKKEQTEKANKEKNLRAIEMAKQQLSETERAVTEGPLNVREETEAAVPVHAHDEEELAQMKSDDHRHDVLMTHETPKGDGQLISVQTSAPQVDPLAQRRLELEKEETKFPYFKLFLVAINAVIIIIVGLIRGTKVFRPIADVDFTCGWDFLWFALGIVLFTIAGIVNIYFITKWQKEKVRVGYVFLPEEPILNTKNIVMLLIASIIAGIVGALVALGGALLIAPTLLDMGMPPVFSAATTGLFLVFSMFNAMFGAILKKGVTGVEIAWFLPLAILFSFVSSKVVNYYVKKTGKQSVILMILFSIVFIGFGCVIYNLINGLVEDSHLQTTFTPVC